MRTEPIHTEQYKGHTINIFNDEDPISPEESSNDECFLVYDHRSFYVNREGFNPETIHEHIQSTGRNFYEGYHVFPVYAYIHSGVSLSLGRTGYPFNCRWDTSMRGFVLVKRSKGWSYTKDKATKIAQAVVDEWNDYLSGNVYGYEALNAQGEQVDSCWGYYGDYEENALSEARSTVNAIIKHDLKKHIEQVKKWISSKIPFIYRRPFEYSL